MTKEYLEVVNHRVRIQDTMNLRDYASERQRDADDATGAEGFTANNPAQ